MIREIIDQFETEFEEWYNSDLSDKQELEAIRNRYIALIKSEIEKELPKEADVRPEITEWTFNKNRDAAEGFNSCLARVHSALDKVIGVGK